MHEACGSRSTTEEAVYSTRMIHGIAELAQTWDKMYWNANPSKIESALRREFRLLLQCLIVLGDPNPLSPDRARIEKWLALSRGLDVYKLRASVLKRLCVLTSCDSFRHDAVLPTQSLDRRSIFGWRQYWVEVHRRSRRRFEVTTTADVIQAEINTWPYYFAMGIADAVGGSPKSDNVYDESHERIAKLLFELLMESGEATARPLRILEIGCGAGDLLRVIRKALPQADLVATNISGTTGVHPEVLNDPKVEIIESGVEALTFAPHSFDAVVSTEVIEHLVKPYVMVVQVDKLLKPGGAFIVTAPSVHVQFLSKNPLTYLTSLASVIVPAVLPPFHDLYEPLTDLPLVHYAFSVQEFKKLFRPICEQVRISTYRFTHLVKFRLNRVAERLPLLKQFGGIVVASGRVSG